MQCLCVEYLSFQPPADYNGVRNYSSTACALRFGRTIDIDGFSKRFRARVRLPRNAILQIWRPSRVRGPYRAEIYRVERESTK